MAGRIIAPPAAGSIPPLSRLAPVSRLLAAMARFAAKGLKAVMRRREIVRLSEYDDRLLSDIGLTREDVAGVRRLRWLDDPTRALAERRRKRLRS